MSSHWGGGLLGPRGQERAQLFCRAPPSDLEVLSGSLTPPSPGCSTWLFSAVGIGVGMPVVLGYPVLRLRWPEPWAPGWGDGQTGLPSTPWATNPAHWVSLVPTRFHFLTVISDPQQVEGQQSWPTCPVCLWGRGLGGAASQVCCSGPAPSSPHRHSGPVPVGVLL